MGSNRLRSDLFVAPIEEINEEHWSLCHARGIPISHSLSSNDWAIALSVTERRYWWWYELCWFSRYGGIAANQPNLVFGFNDNPET